MWKCLVQIYFTMQPIASIYCLFYFSLEHINVEIHAWKSEYYPIRTCFSLILNLDMFFFRFWPTKGSKTTPGYCSFWNPGASITLVHVLLTFFQQFWQGIVERGSGVVTSLDLIIRCYINMLSIHEFAQAEEWYASSCVERTQIFWPLRDSPSSMASLRPRVAPLISTAGHNLHCWNDADLQFMVSRYLVCRLRSSVASGSGCACWSKTAMSTSAE